MLFIVLLCHVTIHHYACIYLHFRFWTFYYKNMFNEVDADQCCQQLFSFFLFPSLHTTSTQPLSSFDSVFNWFSFPNFPQVDRDTASILIPEVTLTPDVNGSYARIVNVKIMNGTELPFLIHNLHLVRPHKRIDVCGELIEPSRRSNLVKGQTYLKKPNLKGRIQIEGSSAKVKNYSKPKITFLTKVEAWPWPWLPMVCP